MIYNTVFLFGITPFGRIRALGCSQHNLAYNTCLVLDVTCMTIASYRGFCVFVRSARLVPTRRAGYKQ